MRTSCQAWLRLPDLFRYRMNQFDKTSFSRLAAVVT